ncbi:MAG: dockerin type I domain-containing protein [Planctomycetota bacterium]|nr:dockerin type I domain-containing protein [Planctomycetota bacterium]
MGRKCSQFTDSDFLSYIRRDCDKEKWSILDEHIKNCLTCSVRLEGLKKGAKALTEGLPAPRVPEKVESRIERMALKRFGRPPPLFSLPFWVGALCALLLVGILLFVVMPISGLKWKTPSPPIPEGQDRTLSGSTREISILQKEKEELVKELGDVKTELEEKKRFLKEREAEIASLNELKKSAEEALKNAMDERKSLLDKIEEEKAKLTDEIASLREKNETLKNEKDSLVTRLEESELFVRKLGERVAEEEAKVFQISAQLEEMRKSLQEWEERAKSLLQQITEAKSLIRILGEDRAELERRYFAMMDLDGDGTLTTADSVYLCNKIASEEEVAYNRAVDLNGDGRLDVADALLITKLLEERKKR